MNQTASRKAVVSRGSVSPRVSRTAIGVSEILPQQTWILLTPSQQQAVFQTVVQVCRQLTNGRVEEVGDEC